MAALLGLAAVSFGGSGVTAGQNLGNCADQAEFDLQQSYASIATHGQTLTTDLVGQPYDSADNYELKPTLEVVCPALLSGSVYQAIDSTCEFIQSMETTTFEQLSQNLPADAFPGVEWMCDKFSPARRADPNEDAFSTKQSLEAFCTGWISDLKPGTTTTVTDLANALQLDKQEDGSYVSPDIAKILHGFQAVEKVYTSSNAFGICVSER